MRISLALLLAAALSGQRVETIAGTGEPGHSGDGGAAAQARIANPYGLVIGLDGALYFCEVDNHCIRRVDLTRGTISTFAGNRQRGYSGDGGPARSASMNEPYELRFDTEGNLYVVEMRNHAVRKIDPRGTITTIAGTGSPGFSGDGGPATQAQLRNPHSIVLDRSGGLLICDIGNHRIRRVDLATGTITTWAGTGERKPTPDGAPLQGTPLNGPRALDIDPLGNLYLALREGNAVFRIDARSRRLQRLAKDAKLAGPKGIAWSPGNAVYLADTESHTIRRIDLASGAIRAVLGTGERGNGAGGDPLACALARPHGVFVDRHGRLYVGDSEAHKIRVVQ